MPQVVRQDKIMQDENSSSLSNAKEQLQVQAQQLSDAQQQVDELLQAQMRLKAMLISPPGVASSTGAPQPGDSAGDAAKASEARVLLGKAVRRQTEQQLQIEAMSASLRDEGTRALIACQKARDNQHQVEQLQEQLATLREQLSKEQRERMESEAASRKTEEQLKANAGYTRGDMVQHFDDKIYYKCGEKGNTQNAKKCKRFGKTVKCSTCGRNHHTSVHDLLSRNASDAEDKDER